MSASSPEPFPSEPPPPGLTPDAVRLVAPTVALHASWCEAMDEIAALGEYAHGSGLTKPGVDPSHGRAWRPEELTDRDLFLEFVEHLRALPDPGYAAALGLVADTKRWLVSVPSERTPDVPARYLGALSLRHELNAFLLDTGGHIGYGVRPSARRRGLAGYLLGQGLQLARGLGLQRVLITCDDDNVASARTIENAGGVLEDVRADQRRYWIAL